VNVPTSTNEGVGLGVETGVPVAIAVAVATGVAVAVAVAVTVGAAVAVGDTKGTGEAVGVAVGVGTGLRVIVYHRPAAVQHFKVLPSNTRTPGLPITPSVELTGITSTSLVMS
jgi:hypothetical protein